MTNIWPFRISEGSTETLQYKTDVLKTYSGEQRLRLRKSPRTIFDYTCQMDEQEFARAKQVIWNNQLVGQFYVPVWSDAQLVDGTVSSGASSLSLDATEVEWTTPNIFPGADGGFLTVDVSTLTVDSGTTSVDQTADPIGYILLWESIDKFSLLRFGVANGSGIDLVDSPTEDYEHPFVIPIRLCYPIGDVTISRQSDNNIFVSAQFMSVETPETIGSFPNTYGGYNIWADPYNNLGSVEEKFIRPAQYNDNGVGVIQIDPYYEEVYQGQTISFFYQGKSDKYTKVNFIKSLYGKQKAFWLPSFVDEAKPIFSASSSNIYIKPYMEAADYIGKHIFIEYTYGDKIVVEVVDSEVIFEDSVMRLGVSGLGGRITSEANTVLGCFATLVRSDTDSFTFEIGPANSGRVSFNVVEVPN